MFVFDTGSLLRRFSVDWSANLVSATFLTALRFVRGSHCAFASSESKFVHRGFQGNASFVFVRVLVQGLHIPTADVKKRRKQEGKR